MYLRTYTRFLTSISPLPPEGGSNHTILLNKPALTLEPPLGGRGRYITFFLYLLSYILYFTSCSAPTKISSKNIADVYHPDEHALHPYFRLLHINDSVSQLYFKIDENELLYERKNPSDSFTASVRVSVVVTPSYDSPFVIDSNSAYLNFISATPSPNTLTPTKGVGETQSKGFAVSSMFLKLRAGNTYLITITTSDLNSKRDNITYLDADKTSFLGAQNFLIRNPDNGNILFSNNFDSSQTIAICPQVTGRHKLFVQHYKNNFPIAAPPFTGDDEIASPRLSPDTSFVLYPAHGGAVFLLTLKLQGAYHIMSDSSDFRGLTIFRFDDFFPGIALAYQMVMPLRYISTNDEFDQLTASKNPKKNVDDFWLNASGDSKDRAKQLIHNYYTRVEEANTYFTSYLEGWKTDRGMIYIIFGSPGIIFRTATTEVWTYGEDRSYLSLTFTFNKLDNPFTDNDYSLERSPNFRNIWFNAVDVWREGRIY